VAELRVGTWNLENLFRPDSEFGPDREAYRAKLTALAGTINEMSPDVLGVQEVGQPEALADLVDRLDGQWHTALSEYFAEHHPIRVGFLCRHPITVLEDVAALPKQLNPPQAGDNGELTTAMGRGALAVRIEADGAAAVDVVACHLKSKLLSFPGPNGTSRFTPHDEGERARYAAYALYRRAAAAVTVRGMADRLLEAQGQRRRVVVLGDLNDEPQAATTQILYGPPGSQLGTPGADRPDHGDAMRLVNLAGRIPEGERYTRVFEGHGELIDHLLVSHALLGAVLEVRVIRQPGHPAELLVPSINADPHERRNKPASDHAPVLARFTIPD
jgi:endonuclease/exonuclease/phosphatase family metal-dependent hydrolase